MSPLLRQMSKTRYSEIGHEYMPAPTVGIAPDVPPWVMTNAESPIVENLMVRNGKLQVRNSLAAIYDMQNLPTQDSTGATISPRIPVTSVLTVSPAYYSGEQHVFIGQRRQSDLTYDTGLDPQHCHRIGKQFFRGAWSPVGNEIFMWNDYAFPVTVETMPGPRYANLGSNTYRLSYASAVGMTFEDTIQTYATNVIQDNFGAGSAVPSIVAGTPRGGIDITTWLNRVWVLGGAHPDNGSIANGVTSRLFYTNPVTQLMADTDWKDPSSGLINQIDVDPDGTDTAVGIAPTTIGLIIFRQRSIYVMRGSDPTSWIVRRMTNSIGCVDARSIVVADNGVYFISAAGLMWTDGTTLKNVSGALQQTLESYVRRWEDLAAGGTGAYFTAALIRSNYLLVTFGHRTKRADNYFDDTAELSAVLDLTTGAWVTVSTALDDGVTSTPLGYAASVGYGAVTASSRYLVSAAGWYATTTVSDATYDFTQGSALVDIDLTVTQNPSPETDPPTTYPRAVPFTAHWRSRAAGLSSGARSKSQLQRAFLDMALTAQPDTALGTVTMQVLTAEEQTDAAAILASVTVQGDDARLNGKVVAHLDVDFTGEVESGTLVDVKIAGPTQSAWPVLPDVPQDVTAELHGAGLAFQSAANMRNPVN